MNAKTAAAIAAFDATLSEFDSALLRAALGQRPECRPPALHDLIERASPTEAFRASARRLLSAMDGGIEKAAHLLEMLEVATAVRHRTDVSIEAVWTGPDEDERRIRRTASVARGLIDEATEDLLLVSFSAYPIAGLNDALKAAGHRGVKVRLILETSADSGGRLSIDAAAAFRQLDGLVSFLHWPQHRRTEGGLMHAKVVVADRRAALVTSANLTEHAHERNIEVGLLVRGGTVPASLCETIDRMIDQGLFAPWAFQ